MLSEIYLPTAQRMLQRQITTVLGIHHKPLFADVLFYAGIAAAETVLIPQTAENPPNGVPLLARDLTVGFQPFINYGNEISQHRIARWLGIRQIVLAPVELVGVLLDGLEAVTCLTGNFSQTQVFIFVQILDIIYLSHS
ncbi:hypothetical protein SDC9_194729 [bioreactor metagenome]|uniref:Uncharacterized protein n=1 Tax=bioreactor metagenome TaxID=1076179 RepID=A0A645I9M6_9ZZZZ